MKIIVNLNRGIPQKSLSLFLFFNFIEYIFYKHTSQKGKDYLSKIINISENIPLTSEDCIILMVARDSLDENIKKIALSMIARSQKFEQGDLTKLSKEERELMGVFFPFN